MIPDRRRWALLAAVVFCCVGAAPPAQKVIARIDLSTPFHLAPGWTFEATQGPPVQDPNGDEGDLVPGEIQLCVHGLRSAHCAPDLDSGQRRGGPDEFSEMHYLHGASIVYPRGKAAPPLLMVDTASVHSGDGDQIRAVQLVGYDPKGRRFVIAFREQLGQNNNQEVRFVDSGPLRGDIISVHPTENRPFGYWITVNRLGADYRYKQVLRYRSATLYGDQNPLAVIDSEMPNILRHLGLWHPGDPLPLPKGRCPRPHLVKTELWCF